MLGEIRTEDFRALVRRIISLPTAQDIERELEAALGGLVGRKVQT